MNGSRGHEFTRNRLLRQAGGTVSRNLARLADLQELWRFTLRRGNRPRSPDEPQNPIQEPDKEPLANDRHL
jgi:hypothetical protein